MQQQSDGQVRGLIALVDANPGVFSDDFREWLGENRHVWAAFEREALKVWHRGRRHYSARTIIEVLRHESALADTGPDFKINNNSAPDLARLWRLYRPEAADLFELRHSATSSRGVAP